jgi:hypothetical protein
MQESTTCFSKADKPNKYEPIPVVNRWVINNTFLDTDKKRTTVCKEPNYSKVSHKST